jgi:tripartite-type tricarboxylate transporter receptor subunit TctC
VKNVKELIALARARPGQINYSSSGPGGAPHLGGELLKSMARIDLVHIPYKGTAPAAGDVAGGQIAAMFATALTARPMIDGGRVRALAVSGPQRIQALPNVPPVADAVPGYAAMQWYGLLAPAGTPQAIVARLNAEAIRSLRSDEMRERLAVDGAEPQGSTPEEFGALIKSELEKWARVTRAAGIEPQ